MSPQTPAEAGKPTVGPGLIVVAALMFMVAAVVNLLNPMQGEEALAGTTFAGLQQRDPALADTVWHLNAGINTIAFGIAVLVAWLAWTRLRRGSREAWYSIAVVAVTFAVAIVLAHVPVGHPSASHWGPPLDGPDVPGPRTQRESGLLTVRELGHEPADHATRHVREGTGRASTGSSSTC